MKKQISILLSFVTAFTFFFSSCEKNDDLRPSDGSILPEKFAVDIPSALSSDQDAGKKSASAIDTLNGNAVYSHLRTFIHIGESGAEIVGDIIRGIGIYSINRPMELSYEGDDDGRIKNLVVVESSFFDGINWEFQLTISDAESERNEDGGLALQIFWNRNPRKGIAILKPYNIDRNSDEYFADAIFRIDYSEAGDYGYDAHMIVAISGLPLAHPLENPYSMKALKMFVGKKGDVVDVYGNSDHPNAVFFTPTTGFNWAFVASGHDRLDIGVAEVGLPPSNLDEPSRDVLLGNYAIKEVFSAQIYKLWPFIDEESVNAYLYNTEAPGFFDEYGFVQGGTSPGSEYDELEMRLDVLSPYNPKEINSLDIEFKTE
jgi:hypothetical protein